MYDLKTTHKLRRRILQAREHGRFEEEKQLHFELGSYLTINKKYEEALNAFKEALSISQRLGNQLDVATANRRVGETYINLGQFDVAVKYVDAYLMYFNSTNDKFELQRGYIILGQIHLCRAEYLRGRKSRTKYKDIKHLLESSLMAFEKGLLICEKELENIGKREKLKIKVNILRNLGSVMGLMGNFDEGNNYLSSAIQISRAENFKDSLFWCYLSQGDLFLRANDEENALAYFNLALSIVISKDCKIDILKKKAATYFSLGNYSEAKNALKEIYLLKSGNDPDNVKQLQITRFLCKVEKQLISTKEYEFETRKRLYKRMGDACCIIENYKQAIKAYLKMLHCAESNGETGKELVPYYILLAQTYKDDEKYDLALKYCVNALDLTKDSPSEATHAHLNLGELYYYLGYDYEIVHDAYKKALELAEEVNDKNQQIKALNHLIHLENDFGHFLIANKNKEALNQLKNDIGFNSDDNCGKSDAKAYLESEFDNDTNYDEVFSDEDIEIPKPKKYQNKLSKYKLKVNEVGETELQSAVIKGDYKKVKSLIDRGHPVNVRDTVGWTPLHEACNHGYVDIVDLLLNSGADINDLGGEGCDGITPLHDAAENGHFQVIDMLLKRGASSESLTKAGKTPLDCFKQWRKRSTLTGDEEMIYFRLCERLKSKFDSEDFQKKRKQLIVDVTDDESESCSMAEIIPAKVQKFSNDDDCSLRYRLEDMDINESTDLDEETGHQMYEAKSKKSAVDVYKSALNIVKKRRKETEERESPESNISHGAKEYKLAIEGVRQRRENKGFDRIKKKKKNTALVDEKEVVRDWLEDDLGIMSKGSRKRRTVDNSNAPRRQLARKRSIEVISDIEDDSEEENREIPQSFGGKQSTVGSPSDLGSEESRNAFELAGSSEIQPNADPGWRDDQTILEIQDASETKSAPLNSPTSEEGNRQKTDNSHEPFKITVRVANDTLRFSIPRPGISGLTCGWLVEEVAQRYVALKNVSGRKPYFVIALMDGAIIIPTEALDSIQESEIEAKLLCWKEKTLYEVYKEELHKLEGSVHHCGPASSVLKVHVAGALGLCETSNDLILHGLGLTPREFLPIFKTIEGAKSQVDCLDLSHNNLGDEGIADLMNCLRVCAVERLLLASNNITAKGIEYFSEALEDVPEENLCKMKVLDVSFNSLTDESVDFLNKIVEKFKNLVHLGTNFCDLTGPLKTKLGLSGSGTF